MKQGKTDTFDATTARKLINEYGENINMLIKENKILTQQVSDLKHSLNINKKLLYEHIEKRNLEDNEALLREIKQENSRLSSALNKNTEEKIQLEQMIYKLQQTLNEQIAKSKVIIDKKDEELFLLKNKYEEAKCIMESYRSINMKKNCVKEIYIGDPTKLNLEMMNELKTTRDLIQTISKNYNQLKNRNDQLNTKLDRLETLTSDQRLNTQGYYTKTEGSCDFQNNNFHTDNFTKEIDQLEEDLEEIVKLDSSGSNQENSEGDNTDEEVNLAELPTPMKKNTMPVNMKHLNTKSMAPLDFTKLKSGMNVTTKEKQEIVQTKEKKLSKTEELIKFMKKKLVRTENRVIKYKKAYKELKEIAWKYKARFDEINSKFNEFFGKNPATTKETTERRKEGSLNNSKVVEVSGRTCREVVDEVDENNIHEDLDEDSQDL